MDNERHAINESRTRDRERQIERLLDKCGIVNTCTRQVLKWGIEEIADAETL